MQHIDAFEDQNIRLVDDSELIRQNVIGQVRIARCFHIGLARLDRRQETQERADIVAFGKALALHQVFAPQNLIRIKKSVCRDEIDLRAGGPARQKLLQDTRRRRFANRHRAGNADDKGRLVDVSHIEKAVALFEQQL
ncbi:hypothetical protein D3C78_1176640 [compost metagenome]